jgi:twitching motility protein PilI
MANRQSLRELQERLAQRLQAAKAEAVTASWLAVEAQGQRYLLPLVQAGEIFSWTTVQAVPYTKPWFAGVVSLRGGLHGVVDLAGLVGGAYAGTGRAAAQERITSEARLVSLHPALGVNAVLWIDRLLGLRNPAMFASLAEPPPHAPACFARCLVDPQGLRWQELDLQTLAAEPDFLAIAA